MNDNREKLAEAARSSVQKSGLKGLSFRTLASEVGIKSSSVHYYYPEKSDLAQELIERYSENLFASLDKISSSRTSLKRKISAFIKIFEEVSQADNICLCGMMAAEVEALSDINKSTLSQVFINMEQWLTTEIDAHPDEFNDSLVAPAQFAKSMLASLEGALLLDRVVGNRHRMKAQKELYLALLS